MGAMDFAINCTIAGGMVKGSARSPHAGWAIPVQHFEASAGAIRAEARGGAHLFAGLHAGDPDQGSEHIGRS